MKDTKCILCGKPIKGVGNNPAPFRDKGRCCDECNRMVVAARFAAYVNSTRGEGRAS